MIRSYEYSSIFMSRATYSLGHLLLSLNLHVHIARTCLDSPYKPLLCYLHRLYLTRRVCQALQRRLILSHLRYAACRHQWHIGSEHILGIPSRKFTSVQADFRHLAMLQNLKNLLCCLILYCCTNHIQITLLNPTAMSILTLSCRAKSRHTTVMSSEVETSTPTAPPLHPQSGHALPHHPLP